MVFHNTYDCDNDFIHAVHTAFNNKRTIKSYLVFLSHLVSNTAQSEDESFSDWSLISQDSPVSNFVVNIERICFM